MPRRATTRRTSTASPRTNWTVFGKRRKPARTYSYAVLEVTKKPGLLGGEHNRIVSVHPTREAALRAADKHLRLQMKLGFNGKTATARMEKSEADAWKRAWGPVRKRKATAVKKGWINGGNNNPSPKFFYVQGKQDAESGGALGFGAFESKYSTPIAATPWMSPGKLHAHYMDGANAARPNPTPSAAALYQSFTGLPSEHETIVSERVHEHRHLAGLARLVSFKLRGIPGQLKFPSTPPTFLAFNETGTQMFIRGGDQSIDLGAFNRMTRNPVDTTKELVILGEIESLCYSGRKPFLGGEHTKTGIYKHKLGGRGKTKSLPSLLYDTRSQLLSVAGGSYYIKPDDYDGEHSRGIVD